MAKRTGYTDICHRCKQGVPKRFKNCPHCGVDLERLTLSATLLRVLITLGLVVIFALTIWVLYWGLSGSENIGALRPAGRDGHGFPDRGSGFASMNFSFSFASASAGAILTTRCNASIASFVFPVL